MIWYFDRLKKARWTPLPEPVHDVVLDDGQLGVDPEDLGAGAGGEGRPGHADVLCHGRGGHAGGGTMLNDNLLGLYARESSHVLASFKGHLNFSFASTPNFINS